MFHVPRIAVLSLSLLLIGCDGSRRSGAPVPESPVETTGCGSPVDGLALSLVFDETAFAGDERVGATVRALNVGTEPLVLENLAHDWHHRIRFETVGGGPVYLGGSGLFIERDAPEFVTLPPQGAWQISVDPAAGARRYLRLIPDRKPGDDWDYRDRLPAGRYRASIEFSCSSSGREDAWTGTVTSNAVEIEVGD